MTVTAKATTSARKPLPSLTNSQYRTFHSSGLFRAQLEQLPTWVAARDALLALKSIKLPAAEGDQVRALADEITESTRDGEITTAAVMTEATALAHRGVALDLARRALDAAHRDLINELDEALRDNWGTLYAGLGSELTEVWNALRAIAHPQRLTDADAAIAADRVDDYRAFNQLLDRYRGIRARQAQLDRNAGSNTGTFPELTYLQHPDKAWSDWHAHQIHGDYKPDPNSHGQIRLTPPWAIHDPASQEWVLWALEADVEVWVPTPAQAKREADRLTALLIPGNEPATAGGRA